MKTKFAVLLLVALCAALVSCGGNTEARGGLGKAPDFNLPTVDGEAYGFAEKTSGKVVILDFWATWCPPCRAEIPHFQALHEQYASEGLVVLGVSLDRTGPASVRSFMDQNGVTYPVVMGDQSTASLYGGVRGIPTTFIIDRDGNIVEKYVGYQDKEVFESRVKELL